MTTRRYRYPCTGHIDVGDFASFLRNEIGPSRANLRAFAQELGTRFDAPHISLVNSGSSANLAAAMALAERCGSGEVVTAGFTFPTTVSGLQIAGFRVRVVDSEPDGFGMAPASLEKAMSPETRAVCITHFLGFPAQLKELVDIARKHNVAVLQDACETLDLRLDGEPAHRFGDLATWSFYHPHHLSSFGGGAVVAVDGQWQQLVESITHWGRACTCHYSADDCIAPAGMDHSFWYLRAGQNLEMSELNACFGRFQLRDWERQEAIRKRNYTILFDRLSSLPKVRVYSMPRDSGSPFVFPVTLLTGDTKSIASKLESCGIEVRSLMGGAITQQPAFSSLPHDGLTNCRQTAGNSFFVGIHQTLPEEDVRQVAEILSEVLG